MVALSSRRDRDDDRDRRGSKTSGTPRTRVMGDEEGTGIQFGNLSGGGEEDQGQIQEGQAFRPYIERWHAPPLCSGQCSSVLLSYCCITVPYPPAAVPSF